MAPEVRIVPATAEHAVELAPRMRAADVEEVKASGNYTPLAALAASLQGSVHARTMLIDGRVACMFGVMPMPKKPKFGAVWLLTGDLVEKHPKAFLRACRREVWVMLGFFPVLVNAVDARYKAALRWVSWLGFEIAHPVPFGAHQLPFHPIRIRRKDFVHV